MVKKVIITIKAKVKSLTGQNDDITIENIGAVGGKGIETKVSSIVSNTLHNNENQTIIVNPDDKKMIIIVAQQNLVMIIQ